MFTSQIIVKQKLLPANDLKQRKRIIVSYSYHGNAFKGMYISHADHATTSKEALSDRKYIWMLQTF